MERLTVRPPRAGVSVPANWSSAWKNAAPALWSVWLALGARTGPLAAVAGARILAAHGSHADFKCLPEPIPRLALYAYCSPYESSGDSSSSWGDQKNYRARLSLLELGSAPPCGGMLRLLARAKPSSRFGKR